LAGDWLEAATGLPGAQIQGIHLRLPGYGDRGPTLEIFQYSRQLGPLATAVNRPGFGHIAFAVHDVQAAHEQVLAAGGSAVGEIQSLEIPDVGQLTFAYMADPEGNVIEIQHWET
jgi:catechol 2,3-dioxygenase-like lactoylglutathione lyase family enzyme